MTIRLKWSPKVEGVATSETGAFLHVLSERSIVIVPELKPYALIFLFNPTIAEPDEPDSATPDEFTSEIVGTPPSSARAVIKKVPSLTE